MYVYDAGLHVLASNRHDLIDADLSGLKDIKGHAFAAAMLARDRATSMDYTLFRWPDGGYRGGETRYAYFTQFPLGNGCWWSTTARKARCSAAGAANRWSRP